MSSSQSVTSRATGGTANETQTTVSQTDADESDTCSEDLENSENETSTDDESEGSLKDFITNRIVRDTSRNASDISTSNIIEGRRTRKPTQRYVPRNYLSLMLEDVDPDEIAPALFEELSPRSQSKTSDSEDEEYNSKSGTDDEDEEEESEEETDDFEEEEEEDEDMDQNDSDSDDDSDDDEDE